MNQSQLREIEDLYNQGHGTRYIAGYFGIGKTTVLSVLKRRGVELRPRGHQKA